MKDIHNNIQVLSVIDPYDHGTGDTAKAGEIIDMQGANALEFIIQTGSLADADATFTVLVEESDASDLSGGNAVADADLLGTEAGASFIFSDDNKIAKIGYIGNKRYVRLTITPANNTGACLLSACAVRGYLGYAPNTTQLA